MYKDVAPNSDLVAPDGVRKKLDARKAARPHQRSAAKTNEDEEPQEREEPNKRKEPKPKQVLTDRGLKALKDAKSGKRDMHWDAALPSFGVRVTDRGAASFVIMRRLHGKVSMNVAEWTKIFAAGQWTPAREGATDS